MPTAESSTFEDIKIDGFAVGLHVQGPSNDLLTDVMFDKIRIGVKGNPSNPSVNMAIHLDGHMGNIHFTNFQLSGWQRILLFDGPADSGASASFTEGTLNLTKTPGIPAVEVSTTVGLRMLQLSQIQDWETAVPFLELKNGANVIIDGIGASGDVMDTPMYPTIHTEAGAFGTLAISNSKLAARSSGANLIKLDAVGVLTQISNSLISGVITFNNNAPALISNTWCKQAWAGSTVSVKSRGNFQHCPDVN